MQMLPPRLHGVGEGAPALAAEQAGLGVLADGQGQPYLLQPWQYLRVPGGGAFGRGGRSPFLPVPARIASAAILHMRATERMASSFAGMP